MENIWDIIVWLTIIDHISAIERNLLKAKVLKDPLRFGSISNWSERGGGDWGGSICFWNQHFYHDSMVDLSKKYCNLIQNDIPLILFRLLINQAPFLYFILKFIFKGIFIKL